MTLSVSLTRVSTLLLLSCATARLPVGADDSAPASPDKNTEAKYQETLARYTQSRALYDNFDTRMFVRATWQSQTFVDARARRTAAFRALPANETEALVASEQSSSDGGTSFFVAVYATDYRTDDLEKSNSIWRLALLSNGAETVPTSVVRLGRAVPQMRAIYSYTAQFWTGYWVTFPKAQAPFKLRFASAIGQSDLPFAE